MLERIRSKLDKLRKGKKELADTGTIIQDFEEKTNPDPTASIGGWKVYDSGARGRNGYFKEGSPFSFGSVMSFEKVQEDIATRQKNGGKVMVLDIMGQGRVGYDLGADTSIGWTYQSQGEEELPGRIIETGDLFDKDVLHQLLANLEKRKTQGNTLTDVFFRAEGGLGMYADNAYALSYLYSEVFNPLYKMAPIGTRFFLGMKPYLEQISKVIDALETEGFKISSNDSGYGLLIKTEDKEALPSLRLLSNKYNLATEG